VNITRQSFVTPENLFFTHDISSTTSTFSSLDCIYQLYTQQRKRRRVNNKPIWRIEKNADEELSHAQGRIQGVCLAAMADPLAPQVLSIKEADEISNTATVSL